MEIERRPVISCLARKLLIVLLTLLVHIHSPKGGKPAEPIVDNPIGAGILRRLRREQQLAQRKRKIKKQKKGQLMKSQAVLSRMHFDSEERRENSRALNQVLTLMERGSGTLQAFRSRTLSEYGAESLGMPKIIKQTVDDSTSLKRRLSEKASRNLMQQMTYDTDIQPQTQGEYHKDSDSGSEKSSDEFTDQSESESEQAEDSESKDDSTNKSGTGSKQRQLVFVDMPDGCEQEYEFGRLQSKQNEQDGGPVRLRSISPLNLPADKYYADNIWGNFRAYPEVTAREYIKLSIPPQYSLTNKKLRRKMFSRYNKLNFDLKLYILRKPVVKTRDKKANLVIFGKKQNMYQSVSDLSKLGHNSDGEVHDESEPKTHDILENELEPELGTKQSEKYFQQKNKQRLQLLQLQQGWQAWSQKIEDKKIKAKDIEVNQQKIYDLHKEDDKEDDEFIIVPKRVNYKIIAQIRQNLQETLTTINSQANAQMDKIQLPANKMSPEQKETLLKKIQDQANINMEQAVSQAQRDVQKLYTPMFYSKYLRIIQQGEKFESLQQNSSQEIKNYLQYVKKGEAEIQLDHRQILPDRMIIDHTHSKTIFFPGLRGYSSYSLTPYGAWQYFRELRHKMFSILSASKATRLQKFAAVDLYMRYMDEMHNDMAEDLDSAENMCQHGGLSHASILTLTSEIYSLNYGNMNIHHKQLVRDAATVRETAAQIKRYSNIPQDQPMAAKVSQFINIIRVNYENVVKILENYNEEDMQRMEILARISIRKVWQKAQTRYDIVFEKSRTSMMAVLDQIHANPKNIIKQMSKRNFLFQIIKTMPEPVKRRLSKQFGVDLDIWRLNQMSKLKQAITNKMVTVSRDSILAKKAYITLVRVLQADPEEVKSGGQFLEAAQSLSVALVQCIMIPNKRTDAFVYLDKVVNIFKDYSQNQANMEEWDNETEKLAKAVASTVKLLKKRFGPHPDPSFSKVPESMILAHYLYDLIELWSRNPADTPISCLLGYQIMSLVQKIKMNLEISSMAQKVVGAKLNTIIHWVRQKDDTQFKDTSHNVSSFNLFKLTNLVITDPRSRQNGIQNISCENIEQHIILIKRYMRSLYDVKKAGWLPELAAYRNYSVDKFISKVNKALIIEQQNLSNKLKHANIQPNQTQKQLLNPLKFIYQTPKP